MKKIFIVAGELSGDLVAAWYVRRLRKQGRTVHVDAVGGDALEKAGAYIHQRFETLNIVGIIEIIKYLPHIFRSLKRLSNHILMNHYDEVVLVDFPGFNLRLAQKLKVKNPGLKITYLSPPQLWCWGAWRIKSLKKYCDRLIVLYPFEVDWYKKRGVEAQWLGSPVYDRLREFEKNRPALPESEGPSSIAILPGSRQSEIETLLPRFLKIAQLVKQKNSDVQFILPVAQSIALHKLKQVADSAGLTDVWSSVNVVAGDTEKYQKLSQCCLAISKPGTVTLELALLGIPSIVVYKTSWITYFLARMVVNVNYMSLPNLLLDKEVFKEFIQHDCDPKTVSSYVDKLYKECCNDGFEYKQLSNDCLRIRDLLSGEKI